MQIEPKHIKILKELRENGTEYKSSFETPDEYWELVRGRYIKHFAGVAFDWSFQTTDKANELLDSFN